MTKSNLPPTSTKSVDIYLHMTLLIQMLCYPPNYTHISLLSLHAAGITQPHNVQITVRSLFCITHSHYSQYLHVHFTYLQLLTKKSHKCLLSSDPCPFTDAKSRRPINRLVQSPEIARAFDGHSKLHQLLLVNISKTVSYG